MSDIKNNIYVGFDFSMNKPAATIYSNGKLFFYLWALNLSEKKLEMYRKCGVNAMSRNLDSIDTKKVQNTQLVLIHTIRSVDLANTIITDLDNVIHSILGFGDEDYNLYVCSEGLSYGSKGDATLNLATYKGVLLAKIYEHYPETLRRLITYSPNTLKSTAGCATKEFRGEKMPMIKAFGRQRINIPFKDAVNDGSLILKTKYVDGVDDLVDSYWALMTMIKKEKLPMFDNGKSC